ncbi:MAG: ABC transporter ATP-binding protein [Ruminococcaceae bacterium]|nr:ABC transporter ATP-binding protein [Oscillospiraceae bacterium]
MISFKDVNFAYGKKEILKSFSLQINDGDRICFFAPSGFGKTTVLRLIMGLENPKSGELTGLDKKKISAVFQEDRLLPDKTVKQNIELFANNRDIEKVMLKLGLDNALLLYPDELSGGMARRVAIARALCRDADIYIFDEPFNGIDQKNIEKTAQLIREVTKDKTVLLVTHDRDEAELLGTTIIDISADV